MMDRRPEPSAAESAAPRQAYQHDLDVDLSRREWYVVDASCPLLTMPSPSSHKY